MKMLSLLIMIYSAFAQADAQTGTIIVDRRETVAGSTALYLSQVEFCAAPYSGHALNVHDVGRKGAAAVLALAEGQYACPDSKYENNGQISVLQLGDCQKTTTSELNNVCTGKNERPNTPVEVQCSSSKFAYSELRFRQMVNGFWMRRSAINIVAPNTKPYSNVWSEEAMNEPSAGSSIGSPYVGTTSAWTLLQDKSNNDLKDIVYSMDALIYVNPPHGPTDPYSPIVIGTERVTCEYKCVLSEAGECGLADLGYPF